MKFRIILFFILGIGLTGVSFAQNVISGAADTSGSSPARDSSYEDESNNNNTNLNNDNSGENNEEDNATSGDSNVDNSAM